MSKQIIKSKQYPITFNLKEAREVFEKLDIKDRTKKDYQCRVKKFIDFINTKGLYPDVYQDYKNYLNKVKKENGKSLSVSSKNKYLITFRIYLHELNKRKVIDFDPTLNVKTFKQDRKHKRYGLDDEDINALSKEVKKLGNSKKELRVKSFFSLLYYEGWRQCEISRLDVDDLNVKNIKKATALIKGKSRDDTELIELSPDTARILKKYIKTSGVNKAMFPSQTKHTERITPRAIAYYMKKFFNRCGIDNVTHGIRHYFVTKLLKEGMKSREVMRLSRHKSIDQIEIYNDEINDSILYQQKNKILSSVKI